MRDFVIKEILGVATETLGALVRYLYLTNVITAEEYKVLVESLDDILDRVESAVDRRAPQCE